MKFKLNEIKIIAKEVMDDFESYIVKPDPSGFYNIYGLQDVKKGIGKLEKLNIMSRYTAALNETKFYSTLDDELSGISPEDFLNIDRRLKTLFDGLEAFAKLMDEVLPQENINSVNIKLPPVDDLGELSKVTRDLHNAISLLIVNDTIGGQEKIESVENGSIWLNVFLGTASAVATVAALVWAGAVVYKKITEGRMMEESLRGIKIKNDSLQDVRDGMKASIENLVEAEAKFINSEHFKSDEPENLERIKNGITTMADLISKGAEVHPALMAPEQVSNLFPDPTKLIGLESKIKRIENE